MIKPMANTESDIDPVNFASCCIFEVQISTYLCPVLVVFFPAYY